MDIIKNLNKYYVFQYDIRSADQFYREMIVRVYKLSRLMGINFTDREFSVFNAVFLLAVVFHGMYVYVFSTSMYYYQDDVKKVLLNVTTVGFSIQMMAKLYLFVYNRLKVISLCELNNKYFEEHHSRSKAVKDALFKNAKLTYVLLQLAAMFPSVVMFLVVTFSILYTLITSNKLLPFGFEWMHSDTWTAYNVNILFQIVLLVYVVLATVGSDAIFILFLLVGSGQVDAITAMLQDLNAMIENDITEEQVTEQLREIIKLHQHLTLYMAKMEDSFKEYFLITLAALSFCMIVSLCAVLVIGWVMGIAVILFASSQLFYVCCLGTFWQIKCDELLIEVWTLKWYKLSLRNEKAFLMMLSASQVPLNLTAIFTSLDMSAYLNIHKTLYSICMILIQSTK
ncbi:putative odorant receptor 83c [Armigeres subalbatus]|uniref:putative odorant receptor 83c n=1 Tax=Armigeres subalbatus TaxID=124917 RepID=UPI002ED2A62C